VRGRRVGAGGGVGRRRRGRRRRQRRRRRRRRPTVLAAAAAAAPVDGQSARFAQFAVPELFAAGGAGGVGRQRTGEPGQASRRRFLAERRALGRLGAAAAAAARIAAGRTPIDAGGGRRRRLDAAVRRRRGVERTASSDQRTPLIRPVSGEHNTNHVNGCHDNRCHRFHRCHFQPADRNTTNHRYNAKCFSFSLISNKNNFSRPASDWCHGRWPISGHSSFSWNIFFFKIENSVRVTTSMVSEPKVSKYFSIKKKHSINFGSRNRWFK